MANTVLWPTETRIWDPLTHTYYLEDKISSSSVEITTNQAGNVHYATSLSLSWQPASKPTNNCTAVTTSEEYC